MKKFITIFLLSFLFITSIDAAYLDSNKSTYVNPDGSKVTVYTTGDEYFRYSHDKHKNVLILNEDGYYTYAILENGKAVPSKYIYDGKNIPKNTIKSSDLDLKKNSDAVHSFKTIELPNIFKPSKKVQANGSATGVLNYNSTVIFIRFADESEFVNSTFMNKIISIFGTSNNDYSSLKAYINKVSEGNVNSNSTLLQYDGNNYYSYKSTYKRGYLLPYSSSNTIGYSTTAESERRLHEILLASIKSLPETDKANVDANNDGTIDNIIFILNGESSGNWNDILWPHKWYLSPYYTPSTFSGALPYTYNLLFADELDLDTLAHESMHSLGVPDLYRYSYEGDPVGKWDMMNYNLEGTYISSAVRYLTGQATSEDNRWTTLNYIEESGVYELDLASTNSGYTSYLIPTSDSMQYIQLEYRGNDSSSIYDKNIPGKGLLVSRINKRYQALGNRGESTSYGYKNQDLYYIYRPGETSTYGSVGGSGDLNNAYVTPCTSSTDCSNYIGSKSASATLYSGALTLENGTNTKTYIKNVIKVDNDTIKFEVFPNNDNMYLSHKTYSGMMGDSFKLTPYCASSTCPTTTYTSSNQNVATVDSNGTVKIVGSGISTITVTSDGTTKYCTVTSYNSGIDEINASVIDAGKIKIEVKVKGNPDSVSILRYEENILNNAETVATGLTADSNGNIIYIDTIEKDDFGKTYVYKAVTIEGNNTIFNDLKATVNTKDYLPGQVKNLIGNMRILNAITLSYDKVDGADGYNIYYSNNPLGPYTFVNSTTDTTYDYDNEFGQTYYFKVAAYKMSNGEKYEGPESEIIGVNTKNFLLDAPTNLDATALSNSSIKLVFDKVEGATEYNIYRSTDKKTYKKVDSVYTNEYIDTDVEVGKTYYYKVSAVKMDLFNGYRSDAISIKLTGIAPTNVKISNSSYTSLKITFDKMEHVDGYDIYYSTSKTGTFKKLTSTTKTSYTHSKLTFNKYYYYKVRSYKTVDGKKVYSNYSLITSQKVKTPAPSVSFTPVSISSVKLTWNKISGATSYKVYYSTSENGPYTLLKTVTTNYYTHKNLTFGKTYYYKVVSYRNSTMGGNTIKKYKVIPNSPSIKYSNNVITNTEISGAQGYDLFKSVNNGEFEFVSTLSDNTYLTESSNDLVKYYVKAYKLVGDEKVYSLPSNYISNIKEITTNDYALESNGARSVKVTVDGNEYVDGYYLYMATSKTGTYKKVATSNSNVITYSSLTPSKTYYFKVRPYTVLNGSNNLGNYSEIKSYKHIVKPADINLTNYSYNSVKLSWKKVDGASGYQIKYKEGLEGSYKTITTTSTSYTHKSLNFDSNYYYQVRSYVTISGKKYYSSYSDEKNIQVILPAPKLTLKSSGAGIVTLTIGKVSGAHNYNIYISTDGINYEKTQTNELINVYNNFELSNTYYIKVSAVRNGVEGLISDASVITPQIEKVSNLKASSTPEKATSVNITWDRINGVDGYEVKLEGNPIYSGPNNSYTDKDLTLGKNHNYTVRAYKIIDGIYYYYGEENTVEIKPIALKVQNVKVTPNMKNEEITITFDALEDVVGYKIYRSTSETGTYSEVARCDTNSCVVKNVKPGTYYYYKVIGYSIYKDKEINGQSSDIKKYKLIPDKVTSVKLSPSSVTSIKVAWDKMDNVSGYEVWRATSKTGKYTKVKTVTSTSTTVTSLTTGKTYYFKVRSYKTVNGKKVYGNYSDIISAYPRPTVAKNVKISRYNYSSTQNKISWDKVSGASGYAIYRSLDGTNYSLLKTTTSTSYTDKYASKYSTNYYKVRAYKTISGKKVYSEYSSVVKMEIPEEPSISYFVSSETDSQMYGMFFQLTNKGNKPLKILSSGAKLYDNDYASYDRTAKMIDYYALMNYNTIEYISSYTIQPGTSEYLSYVFERPTWYDQKSRFYFYFIYDGVKYQAYVSSYYGGQYSEV